MERRRSGFLTTLITVIIVVVVAIGIYDWVDDRNSVEQAADDAQTALDNAGENLRDNDLLSKIVDNPEAYYGQEVTVEGEIQDAYSRRVFKISDQTLSDELLVVTRQALTQSQLDEAEEFFEDNADVRATGEIRRAVVADLEAEFGIDLPADIEELFTDQPVLIADSFTFSDTNAVFDFNQGL